MPLTQCPRRLLILERKVQALRPQNYDTEIPPLHIYSNAARKAERAMWCHSLSMPTSKDLFHIYVSTRTSEDLFHILRFSTNIPYVSEHSGTAEVHVAFFFPALILLSCKRFRVGPALKLRFLTQFSYVSCRSGRVSLKISFLNPFENRSPVSGTNHSKRTAVPFRGQTTQISSGLPPKRDCGSKGRPPYTAHIEQW